MSEKIQCATEVLEVDTLPLCPGCEKITRIEPRHIEHKTLSEGNFFCGHVATVVFMCQQPDCNELFIANYFYSPNHTEGEPYDFTGTIPPQPVPEISELLSRHHLPTELRDDLIEVAGCWKNKLYQAFGAMARRAVQSVCKEKGAYRGDLERQITDCRNRNLITIEVADRMHAIRKIGNGGAHPEWEIVTEDMADEGLKALTWMVRETFPVTDHPPAVPKVPAQRRYKMPNNPNLKSSKSLKMP